jgi:hypothetical protein
MNLWSGRGELLQLSPYVLTSMDLPANRKMEHHKACRG